MAPCAAARGHTTTRRSAPRRMTRPIAIRMPPHQCLAWREHRQTVVANRLQLRAARAYGQTVVAEVRRRTGLVGDQAPRCADTAGVARPGVDVRRDRRTAPDRLDHPAGVRRTRASDRRRQGFRHRRRADRLRAGTAARLRRRPHCRDRQHHPHVDGDRAAADVGRLLLFAGAFHRRVRAGAAAVGGCAGDRRTRSTGFVVAAPLHRLDRHRRLRRVSVPDRHHQRRHSGRASCGCSARCGAAHTTKPPWTSSSTSGG